MPRATRDTAGILWLSTTGLSPSLVLHSTTSSSLRYSLLAVPLPHLDLLDGLGLSLFARRYWGNRFCFLFLQLLRCFSWLGWLVLTYGFSQPYLGLPHSETSGSTLASSSPECIVGRHVLLRLCVPRYPPLALCSLTI